ncbi:hypothetical protein C1645_828294 [Glomus cerebriforme]|uniref:Uncharacterized protein n=1 Tax=Glomus cerebriforme TaxID=658196 RepID=A0A397SR45_9GLOM|nr:hypothetical protein C1645_828294 [Glomus cerebriforme]
MSGTEYPTLDIAKAMKEKFDSLSIILIVQQLYLTLILDSRYKTQIMPNNIDIEMAYHCRRKKKPIRNYGTYS